MGRVVTISSTYGAGGSVVAPRVAELLSLPFADRLILARGPGDEVGEHLSDEERQELRRRGFLDRLAHLTGGLGLPVPGGDDLRGPVRQQVEASITELAQRGAVILGRAAAIVLCAEREAFHVRLDGPEARRCRQAMSLGGIDETTARAQQAETDRARARYVARLYDRDPADASLYHLVLDSTAIPLAACARVIELAATSFWEPS